MKIEDSLCNLVPGKYILAISGGVDSMTLLYLASRLNSNNDYEFLVCHANHGIRPEEESHKDEALIVDYCQKNNLEFMVKKLNLSNNTSEDFARKKRHNFLQKTLKDKKFDKIITAHHKDDVIETILINLIRGTGRKGLSSLKDNDLYLRPFVDFEKSEIKEFAVDKKIKWNEDSTNKDTKILRNYIRLNITPRLGKEKEKFFTIYKDMLVINQEIDSELKNLFSYIGSNSKLNRNKLIMLPIEVSYSFLHYFLYDIQNVEVSGQMLKRVRNFIHTAKDGKSINVNKFLTLDIKKDQVVVRKTK